MKVESITVVTPCFDAGPLVARTVESIVGQTAIRSGRLRLEYLVRDGGSKDGTVDAIRRVAGSAAHIVSEPDSGMYDALAKGLRAATGDVVAYLNAGDMYSPTAFDVVADVFEQNEVEWITGMWVTYNEKGQVISADVPYPFRRRLIQAGLYGTPLLPTHIQQESTFWSRRLLDTVDLDVLSGLKLAGDQYLWSCFAREAELRVVQAYLGGFAYHAGQQSEDRAAYAAEQRRVARRPTPVDVLAAVADRVAWELTPRKRLRSTHVRYDRRAGRWR